MAETLLGPFAPHWRGDYNPNTVYQFLDIVYLDGSTWLRIEQTESSGVQPGTDANVWARSSTSASTVDRDRAEAAANLAGQHKDDAQTAAGNAQTAKGAAETAQGLAETAQGASETAQGAAENARDAAVTAKNAAEAAAAAAQNSACPYGIGDILTTLNTASPAVRWPGTVWAAMAPGRVLVGHDPDDIDFNTIGKTGGAKSSIITVAQMPAHNHPLSIVPTAGPQSASDGAGYLRGATSDLGRLTATGGLTTIQLLNAVGLAGSGEPRSHMQPYETVYMWRRTA